MSDQNRMEEVSASTAQIPLNGVESRFILPSMWGQDVSYKGFSTNALFLPGTNLEAFDPSSTWNILRFHLLRICLSFFHDVYGTVLRYWGRSVLLRDSAYTLVVGFLIEYGIVDMFIGILRGLRVFGAWIAWIESYVFPQSSPKDNVAILGAVRSVNLPDSVAVILEMAQFVKKPPPEIPQPFLSADKKIQLPSQKEIKKVMAQRAEWSAGLNTHVAAETIQMLTEASKLASWLICMGSTESLYLYVKKTGVWDDNMETLAELITAELQSLYGVSQPGTNLPRKAIIAKLDGSKTIPVDLSVESSTLETEASGDLAAVPSNEREDSTPDPVSIFLLSPEDYKPRLVNLTKSMCEQPEDITHEMAKFGRPKLILATQGERQYPNCLKGFPLLDTSGDPDFVSLKRPIHFADLVRALRSSSQTSE
ncbi:unnamed protein product [Kuraishia capsulata CBS 1993]|uniref:Uncharacterized protein n=1 Tax=Kuraishia capsulata CBS 1993 TaxID=1382522 RepID=W6MSY6_9ASCO|nr:uncharacterized protein KUCA_T00004319001 [Kuraishia capsulata CBS 1993]CDK28337.1 unnamed protein product [Kuraishia capsulata CBS 1993]